MHRTLLSVSDIWLQVSRRVTNVILSLGSAGVVENLLVKSKTVAAGSRWSMKYNWCRTGPCNQCNPPLWCFPKHLDPADTKSILWRVQSGAKSRFFMLWLLNHESWSIGPSSWDQLLVSGLAVQLRIKTGGGATTLHSKMWPRPWQI